LSLKKPFEINSEFTATIPLTSGNLLNSSSTADTPNSITAPISQASAVNLSTQKIEIGNSFEQFLTQPQLLGAAPNTSASVSASSDILTGKKLEIQTNSNDWGKHPSGAANY